MEVRSESRSSTLRSLSPSHEGPMPQLSPSMTIEEQLRVKFLGENIPSGVSVNHSVHSKISSGKKQSKVIEPEMNIAKINDDKKQVKKTVMMTETVIEITDSDEYSDEEEEPQKTAAQRAWIRRPSINPALLNLSSSEESSSNESENFDGEYITEHYQAPSSSDDNSICHEHSLELSRIMRKTQIENRKIFSEIQLPVEDEKVPGKSTRKLFQSAVRKVKVKRRFSIALATLQASIQDREVMSDASKKRNTVELPPLKTITRRAANRRQAIQCIEGDASAVDIRQHMERLVTSNEEDIDKWIINPFSKFRFRWDIVTVVIILCNVVTLPLEFSFYDGRSDLDRLKMFTDIWFMLDIMLNFRTGVMQSNARGNINMNPTDIRKAYLRSWFVIDMLATVPFDIILSGLLGKMGSDGLSIDDVATYLQIARILKILKLLRLLRLGRFVRYLHRWEEILSMDYGTGENVMKGIQWLLVMLFICHWNACILYLIPSSTDKGGPLNGTMYGPKDTYTFSWVYNANIGSMLPYQQYFWCLFKSMSHMLTIGYGVNTPTLMSDLWTSIFVMFVGALTFALFLSQIISLVDQMKITATNFKRHVREVDDYLRFNRCPTNLKHAVKEYYDYHYRQRIFDEETIFTELNPLLLEEVTTCGIIEFIQDCELFRSCRLDLQHELCKLFKVEMYQPYTNIVLMGRSAKTFSIIRQGVVSVESDRAKRGHFYHLEEGDSFGLEAFSNVSNPRYVTTALSETWVEVLQLNIADLHEFGNQKSEFRDSLTLIDTIANQQLRQSGIHTQIASRQREVRKYYG